MAWTPLKIALVGAGSVAAAAACKMLATETIYGPSDSTFFSAFVYDGRWVNRMFERKKTAEK